MYWKHYLPRVAHVLEAPPVLVTVSVLHTHWVQGSVPEGGGSWARLEQVEQEEGGGEGVVEHPGHGSPLAGGRGEAGGRAHDRATAHTGHGEHSTTTGLMRCVATYNQHYEPY